MSIKIIVAAVMVLLVSISFVHAQNLRISRQGFESITGMATGHPEASDKASQYQTLAWMLITSGILNIIGGSLSITSEGLESSAVANILGIPQALRGAALVLYVTAALVSAGLSLATNAFLGMLWAKGGAGKIGPVTIVNGIIFVGVGIALLTMGNTQEDYEDASQKRRDEYCQAYPPGCL